MELNEDQIVGYNLAVGMYNRLLVENKELLMGIIEASYNQGFHEGAAHIQQIIAAQQQEQEQEQESSEDYVEYTEGTNTVPVEQPSPAPVRRTPEKFSDKLKGVKR